MQKLDANKLDQFLNEVYSDNPNKSEFVETAKARLKENPNRCIFQPLRKGNGKFCEREGKACGFCSEHQRGTNGMRANQLWSSQYTSNTTVATTVATTVEATPLPVSEPKPVIKPIEKPVVKQIEKQVVQPKTPSPRVSLKKVYTPVMQESSSDISESTEISELSSEEESDVSEIESEQSSESQQSEESSEESSEEESSEEESSEESEEQSEESEQSSDDSEQSSEEDSEEDESNMPTVKRNRFGNYEHSSTRIVFDLGSRCAYGVQQSNGDVRKLDKEDITLCISNGWSYYVPKRRH